MSTEVFELFVRIDALEVKYPGMDLFNLFEQLHAGKLDDVRYILDEIKEVERIHKELEAKDND